MAMARGGQAGRQGRRLPAADRQDRIALALAQSGYLSIADLAEHLQVSEMTIRRDLDALAEKGRVERAHGGAFALAGNPGGRLDIVEPAIEERIARNSGVKARIGAVAAGLVEPRQTIAVDIGSTTLCLAYALKDLDVRIFTTSLKIALLLAHATPRVYMPGGEIRGTEPSLVGTMAREQLPNFRFDWFFLGAAGLSDDGLYDYSLEDTEIKRALMAQSARTVALVDSSKFDRLSMVRIAGLADIDMLIAEAPPEGALAERLAEAGVALRLAPP